MRIHLFEDEAVRALSPITDAKPAYAISCGGVRLVDVASTNAQVSASVRNEIAELQEHEYPALVNDHDFDLLINAAAVPQHDLVHQIQAASDGDEVAWFDGSRLIAATNRASATLPANYSATEIERWTRDNGHRRHEPTSDLALFHFPHDVVRYHEEIFVDNLQARIAQGGLKEVADGVFVADDVTIPDAWSVATSDGPIVLEAGSRIGPFTVLQGPVHVGANARVIEHAALKHFVALGNTTKVGGEVEASIIEPFSNKQHYGFLGHSYVGSWVNLGAGTCNSDLKNTYGAVRMTYDGEKIDTGMQFMGCVIGDYAKTAINSTIFTGKTIGFGSMVYGVVAENVVPFVNYAASLGSVTAVSADVITTMQRRMFSRRGREQHSCHVDLVNTLFDLTADARRGMENRPPSF